MQHLNEIACSRHSLPSDRKPSPQKCSFKDITYGNTSTILNSPAYIFRSPMLPGTYTPNFRPSHISDNNSNNIPVHDYNLNTNRECMQNEHRPFRDFFLKALPRQIYLFFLLGLPVSYSTRVEKVFEEAEMCSLGIQAKKATQKTPEHATEHINSQHRASPTTFDGSVTLPVDLKRTWKSFIDSLMKEYKTFNLISALLLSAILAILQIESAASDPLTRFSALLSLICALISLLYGCIYIIRFGSMRKTHKVAEWATEAQRTKKSIFWNVWILLAMPSIWLAWSILFFMLGILSFVWRTGATASNQSLPTITAHDILGPCIAITAIFGLGLMYFTLIFATFQKYGDAMDETRVTDMKIWYPEKNVTPITQGVQPLQRVHQQIPPPPVRRHYSYPPYPTPLNPFQTSPLLPNGVIPKEKEHNMLPHSNRTGCQPNPPTSSTSSPLQSMPEHSSKM